jgi:G:T-mismatch repair DNA endonuclease (very short patch repair protein)
VKKTADNQRRDAKKRRELEALGWRVLELWECEVKSGSWEDTARRFLGPARPAKITKGRAHRKTKKLNN